MGGPVTAQRGGLNDNQRAAVEHRGESLLILAGAGSGKTRVITTRIAKLILEDGVASGSILAVTFTNKAAAEMRERVHQLTGARGAGVTIGTFHAVCARLLRQYGGRLGLTPRFAIYDEEDAMSMLRRAAEKLQLGYDSAALKAAFGAIQTAKHRGATARAFSDESRGRLGEETASLYEAYQRELIGSNACDFADLILQTVTLLREAPELRAEVNRRWQHLLVDEFQDTDGVQFALLEMLVGPGCEVVVVGDDDQSIYGWRGATVANVRHYTEVFAPVRIVNLAENYRSTRDILRVATSVVERLPERMEKQSIAVRAGGTPVRCFVAVDDRDEAERICRVLEGWHATRGWRWRDCAVLCRTNGQMRVVEEALRRRGVDYALVGGTSFFERAEIKDAMAWLRLSVNDRDTVALARVATFPSKGIGATTVRAIEQWRLAHANVPLAEALSRIVSEKAVTKRALEGVASLGRILEEVVQMAQSAGAAATLEQALAASQFEEALAEKEDGEERCRNLDDLRAMLREHDGLPESGGIAGFLERTVLRQASDGMSSDDKVVLTTVHAAKGLEFLGVVVAGLEEGLFPMRRRDAAEAGADDEERRLFYVAVTRAQDELVLMAAMRRRLHGQTRETNASPFLIEVSEQLSWLEGSASRSLPWRGRDPIGPPLDRRSSFDFDQRSGDDWAEPSFGVGRKVPEEGIIFDDDYVERAPAIKVTAVAAQRVRHALFGDGTVVQSEQSAGKTRQTVEFDSGERRTVLANYLQPIRGGR